MNLRYELPTMTAGQPPAITSERACRDWLAVQRLANPAHAQTVLLRQINLLNRYELDAAERLKVLETLREAVAYAQGESARRFAARPLPLNETEQAGVAANRQLWHALLMGYVHCLEACSAGDHRILPHAGLIAQRAISAVRAQLLDFYRIPAEPPAHLWRLLHSLYATAEDLGVAAQPVQDPLQPTHPGTSPQAAFAHGLLLQRASPCQLSARQLEQVDTWMHRFAQRVELSAAAPVRERIRPLAVDLDGDAPADEGADGMARPRWLRLDALGASVKKRLVRLREGETPEALKLGADFPAAASEALLKHLYRHWFKTPSARSHERKPANGECLVVPGVEAIYGLIAGTPFRQPGQGSALSKQQADQIATFGRVTRRHEEPGAPTHAVEHWQLLDESPAGVRLVRASAGPGARISPGQLLALRPRDARHFLLAIVRWARMTQAGEVLAGASLIPGIPAALAAKGTGLSALNDPYRPAFLLPPVAQPAQPETLILPAGWFRLARVIELVADRSRQARLLTLLERGSDFERVAFERL